MKSYKLKFVFFKLISIISDSFVILNDNYIPYDDPHTIFFDTGNLPQEQALAECDVKDKIISKTKQTKNDFIFSVDYSPDNILINEINALNTFPKLH